MSYFKFIIKYFFFIKNYVDNVWISFFFRKNTYLKIKLNSNPVEVKIKIKIKKERERGKWWTVFCPFLSVFLSSLKFPATAKPFLLLSIPKSNGKKCLSVMFFFSRQPNSVFVFTCYYIFRSPDLWNFFLINLSDFEFLSRILGIFYILNLHYCCFYLLFVFLGFWRGRTMGDLSRWISLSLCLFFNLIFNIWFQVREKNKLIAFKKRWNFKPKRRRLAKIFDLLLFFPISLYCTVSKSW
jgi:hypothetical protein